MTFESLRALLEEKLSMAPSIGAKIKIDLDGDGVLFVDGTQTPAVIHEEDMGEADTTFICSLDLLRAIMDGKQDPTMAFMMGKLKVQGSMGYAMKISSILGE